MVRDDRAPLASKLPEGTRYIGRLEGTSPVWPVPSEAPPDAGL